MTKILVTARLLAGLAAGCALAAAGAGMAQPGSVDGSVGVSGGVARKCVLGNPVLSTAGELVNFESLNGSTLKLSQLADPNTLATNAASATVVFAAQCNLPNQVVLESQNSGLYRGGAAGAPPPPGFADGVPYTAQLTWGPVSSTFFVPATTRVTSQERILVGEPVAGDLTLRLTIQAGASNLAARSPLVAGVYTDTLLITVGPQ